LPSRRSSGWDTVSGGKDGRFRATVVPDLEPTRFTPFFVAFVAFTLVDRMSDLPRDLITHHPPGAFENHKAFNFVHSDRWFDQSGETLSAEAVTNKRY
jgi:hypothetical protein